MKPNKRPLDFTGPAADAPQASLSIRPPKPDVLPEPARHAYHWALLVPLFWGASLAAFAFGFQTPDGVLQLSPARWAILAGLCLTPVGVALFAAYVLRQGARLAQEVRRTQALAESMASPALIASVEAGRAAAAVSEQVRQTAEVAMEARRQLQALHETLAKDEAALAGQAAKIGSDVVQLRDSLAAEREWVEALSARLAAQSNDIEALISRQSRMISHASDLAQTQLAEAEAAIIARAADLATAADHAADAGRAAADDLARQALRLEGANDLIAAQTDRVAETLDVRRATLAAMADHLRGEHDRLAAEAESERARMADVLERAKAVAAELQLQSERSAAAMRELLGEAYEHLHDLTAAAEQRRAELDAAAEAALDRLALSVAEHRRALEGEATSATTAIAEGARSALDSADAYAESARARLETLRAAVAEADRDLDRALAERMTAARGHIDALNEHTFAVARQSDEVYERRLADARRLVEQAASLIDEAGEAAVGRLEAGLAGARDALLSLQPAFDSVDARLDALPGEAEARTAEVRRVLESGAAAMLEAARKVADETQALDATFQDRVRRNYDVLARAAQLMDSAVERAAPPPVHTAPAVRLEPVEAPFADPPSAEPLAPPIAPETPEDDAPEDADAAEGRRSRRRARLRLRPALPPEPLAPTPSPPPAPARPSPAEPLSDAAFETLFEAAGGPPVVTASRPAAAAGDDGWTWKELLSAMDEAPLDDDALADRLIREVEAMGVDSAALLPRARVDEISGLQHEGDAAAARACVRRAAPAAVRRLSRRLGADRVLASQTERYLRRYRSLVEDASRRDPQGFMAASMLGSDAGRTFLLLDAAAAEADG